MEIFGFTITRTSKKKREKQELDIFEQCVDTMDKLTNLGKKIIQLPPDATTIQDISELHEHLESLIDIYTRSKFSRPVNSFSLSSLIESMRKHLVEYTKATSNISIAKSNLNMLKELNVNSDDNDSMTFIHRSVYDASMNAARIAAREYFMSLNAIRHVISYDITRIGVGVDIIKQYHDTKGYTIPTKGVEYTVRFKKLSRDEIREQVKQKEADNNE